MNIEIRKAAKEDVLVILGLLRGLAAYENLTEYCEVTEERLSEAMFGDNSFVESLLVFDGATPIGYAIFFPTFASFRGQRGLYLEDIFVEPEYRGKGIGEALLKEIAKLAKNRGFERIDFQVLDWNTSAINFYKKLAADRNEEERHFKFTGEAFENLAS